MTKLPNLDEREWITPGRAAAILGVTPKTIAKMADQPSSKVSVRVLPSGHRRYDRSTVIALAAGGDAE